MYAAAPLYSENFDPDLALKHNIETVFYAKSHSEFFSTSKQNKADRAKMTSIPSRRNSSIIGTNFH